MSKNSAVQVTIPDGTELFGRRGGSELWRPCRPPHIVARAYQRACRKGCSPEQWRQVVCELVRLSLSATIHVSDGGGGTIECADNRARISAAAVLGRMLGPYLGLEEKPVSSVPEREVIIVTAEELAERTRQVQLELHGPHYPSNPAVEPTA